MNSGKKLTKKKNLLCERIDDKIFIVDVKNGRCVVYELNETASIIWNLIGREISANALKQKIRRKFNNKKKLINDAEEFVLELSKRGLLIIK